MLKRWWVRSCVSSTRRSFDSVLGIALCLSFASLLAASPGALAEEEPGCGDGLNPDGTEGSCPIEGGDDDPGSTGADPFSPASSVGNPISLLTGNKRQVELDVILPGASLSFRRFYNSANEAWRSGLGQGWSHTYAVSLFATPDGSREILQSDGRRLSFEPAGPDEQGRSVFRSGSAFEGMLAKAPEIGANAHVWSLPDGRRLRFSGSFLVEIDWPDQRNLSLYYQDRRLASVTDETGRVLRFAYWPGALGGQRALGGYDAQAAGAAAGQLASLTLPDGTLIEYGYDERSNLTRTSFADGTQRQYHYEDETYPSHLTGLTDRTGVRFASWAYDGEGRAISSEHAGGVERVTIAYPERRAIEAGQTVGTTVTNSLGQESLYTWEQPVGGSPRLLASSGAGCASCPATGMRWRYDPAGQLIEATVTGEGTATGDYTVQHAYDDQGRLIEMRRTTTGGASELVERREYERDTDLQPLRIARPSVNPEGERVSVLERDERGRIIAMIERGWSPVISTSSDDAANLNTASTPAVFRPIERVVRLRHDSGRLIAIDGPRDDVEDVTHLGWDQSSRLQTITAPLMPTLHIERYDASGHVSQVRIGEASPYRLGYHASGQIASIDHLGTRTRYEHDAEGKVLALIDTDGRRTQIRHDDAGRLISITDDLGTSLERGYDRESRRVQETVLGSAGATLRTVSSVFDVGARLRTRSEQRLRPGGELDVSQADFEYDANGQLSGIANSSSGARVDIEVDQANRSTSLVRGDGTTTRVFADLLGQDVGFIDARQNRTEQPRDDLGRLVGTISPNTGREWLELDKAGNVVARVRNADQRTTYRRDAAGRVTERRHPDGSITRWEYDPASGLLSRTQSAGGTDVYARDREGRITRHERQLGEHRLVTGYTYDDRSRVLTKRLPDGVLLGYEYHDVGPNAGGLRAITQQRWLGLNAQPIVSDIDLERRDGSIGWESHNGIRTTMTVAPTGEVVSITSDGVLDLQYRFDAAGNISHIIDDEGMHTHVYRNGRLHAVTSPNARHAYDYDVSGNRLSHVAEQPGGPRSETRYRYSPPGSGNQLLESTDVSTGRTRTLRYESGGMPLDSGELQYIYDAERRPVSVSQEGRVVARYAYDALGQRTSKTVYSTEGAPPSTTWYLYEEQQLVAEANDAGEMIAQYLYIEPHRPVARLGSQGLSAIHTDQIGTPRRMSDEDGESVWSATYDPFGKATVTLSDVDQPLRYPGQYFDAETGTHYNYFRTYDPDTGRYLSADPIGLAGGSNGYAYANLNPLSLSDPLGLMPSSNVLIDFFDDLIERSGSSAFVAAAPFASEVVIALLHSMGSADAILLGTAVGSFGIAYEIRQANLALNYNALFQEILLYDPDFAVMSQPDAPGESDIRFLANQLRERQNVYLATGSCGPGFDQDLYDRAVDLRNLLNQINQDIRALGPENESAVVREGVQFPSEAAYQAARFNYDEQGRREGTGRNFADWVAAGMPSDFTSGEFRVTRHGDMPSPRPGQQSHHGVMSAYMNANFPNYNKDNAPAVLMPTESHYATFGVFNRWRPAMQAMMGGTFDWKKVSEADMRALSELMFDAAEVPEDVRREYWRQYEIYNLSLQIR